MSATTGKAWRHFDDSLCTHGEPDADLWCPGLRRVERRWGAVHEQNMESQTPSPDPRMVIEFASDVEASCEAKHPNRPFWCVRVPGHEGDHMDYIDWEQDA